MGAWSHEPFGNDDAGDWALELEEATDLSYIEASLDAVLDADGSKPPRPLLEKAQRALDRIRGEDSELNELWQEADAAEWEASLKSLHAAVSA
jgi:hypothetical protein